MSSPFLLQFTHAVVHQLLATEQIEIQPGSEQKVIESVASGLGRASNQSLISTLANALLACDEVEELYVDNEELKELVTQLPKGAIPKKAGSS